MLFKFFILSITNTLSKAAFLKRFFLACLGLNQYLNFIKKV